ncbi:hypothetical protein [Actinomadura nitritigenes]|uniref:Glycosyltransferase RgtA/B/C/D-like domain-containing protein n=1 Tax=Actinomadura nitritigenes TaxID=134602 RepID=A0ABS3QVU8_9ACTN|nr:hypothetical protein [Actinomadura nitritigenes]MBO2437737.1 hypothetical protein [Actinomadura nitritigenes]
MSAGLSAAAERAAPSASAGRRRAGPAWLLPGGLVLAWLVVLLTHLRTPVPSDQLNYMEAAARFPEPVEVTTEMHQVTRFGLIIPARLAIAVFGYSQAAYATVPVLATLTLLLGTFALGTVLFARPVGAAGALVVVAATPVFADSTDLLPDVLAAGLFTCAAALAVSAAQRPDPPGRALLLTVGALLGWSYLAREFVVFMWPVVLVVLYRRARVAGMVWVLVPIVAIGAAELLLCWRLYGDPLARVLAITGHGKRASAPDIASTYRDKPRMLYVLRLPKTLRTYPDGGLLVALLGLTLLGGLLRPRRMAVPIAGCALLWVPLTLLGGVLDPSAPKLRLQLIRYWFPIFPEFVLGGLGLLWLGAVSLAGRFPEGARPRRFLPAALVLTVALVTCGAAARSWWQAPSTRAGGGTQMESLRSWMRDHDSPGARVWADPRTGKVLRVYQDGAWGGRAWSTRIRAVRPGSEGPRRGDLLVLYDTDGGRLCQVCQKAAQPMLSDPTWTGPRWQQVYGTRDHVIRVYRLAR